MSNSVWPHRRQPPVPGILQARTLEWVTTSFNAWKWKVKVKSLSRGWPSVTPRTAAHQAPPSMGFSRQEYWSGVPLPSPTYPIKKCKNSLFESKWLGNCRVSDIKRLQRLAIEGDTAPTKLSWNDPGTLLPCCEKAAATERGHLHMICSAVPAEVSPFVKIKH